MTINKIRKFAKLRQALVDERNQLLSRLSELNHALGDSEGAPVATAKAGGRGKRRMSAAGRARIAAGAKARWAKYWAKHGGKAGKPAKKGRRKMSAAARAKMAAVAKARWAKAKAAGKSRL
jgi:hypothetical protein